MNQRKVKNHHARQLKESQLRQHIVKEIRHSGGGGGGGGGGRNNSYLPLNTPLHQTQDSSLIKPSSVINEQ